MTTQPRWPKGVTPELERLAYEVLGETPESKKKALQDLRILIEEKGLNSRRDDVFLLRFLRAKKYDVNRAFQSLVSYYKFLEKQSHLFTRKTPSDLKKFIKMNFTFIHPHLLPGGSVLSTNVIGNFDADQGTQQDLLSTLLAVGELLLEHEAAQIAGCTRICDLKNLTIRHCVQFVTPSFASLILHSFQDVWPERLKPIHVVHEPLIVRALSKVVFPLLKKKMREKIHFHGDNLESLHQHVPKEYLPEELGGTMGPLDCKEFAEYFYSHEDLFKNARTFGMTK